MAKFNSTVYSLSLVLFTQRHTHTSKSTDCWPNSTRKYVSIIILLLYLQLLGLATMAIGIWAKVRELLVLLLYNDHLITEKKLSLVHVKMI